MAIGFARGRHLQRSRGHSAGRSIAYEHGCRITVARTGLSYDFRRRTDVVHAEILLPPGADPRLADPATLANAIEDRERRSDSQLGYQVVLAMPRELSREQMIELMRDAAREFFVDRGAAVSIALHPPHGEDEVNWHAHLTGTRRRVEGDRLTDDIQYNGAVRTVGGRRLPADPNYLGRWWTEYQDAWFAERGLDLRVDPKNPLGQTHLGPVRFRSDDARALAEEERQAIVVACHEPRALLEDLTRNSPTFGGRDLNRLIAKNVRAEAVEFVRRKVLSHPDIIALVDPETGATTGRYTTREVREREEAILRAAEAADRRWYGAMGAAPARAARRHGLDVEQAAVVEACASGRGLTIVTGDPGTGKSRTLAAVRDTYEPDHRVVLLAPTNVVAEAARRDGYAEASTIHSALWRLEHGRMRPWDRRTVVIVDEAAMIDSRTLLRLMDRAEEAGARLILCGDDKQLGSVEAGGMFAVLARRHGSARLTDIRRQQVDWQRSASAEMARGEYLPALRRYQLQDRLHWADTELDAIVSLVRKWRADTEARPEASRLVIASTNAAVDDLNAGCREVRRMRGELGGDVRIETDRGPLEVAVGDRLLVTATARRMGLANGQIGTVTRIAGTTVYLLADGGQEIAIPTDRFGGLRHGYATTAHKAQGSTIDETYVLVTGHMRRNAGFVALTRHRHDCHLFSSYEATSSVEGLSMLIARNEGREASVTWETEDRAEQIRARCAVAQVGGVYAYEIAAAEEAGDTERAGWLGRERDAALRWIGREGRSEEQMLDPAASRKWISALREAVAGEAGQELPLTRVQMPQDASGGQIETRRDGQATESRDRDMGRGPRGGMER